MFISEVFKGAPNDTRGDLEARTYNELKKLNIEFERVDNDEAISMEECVEISNKLGAEIRKTVVVCNRQKTNFYLVVMPADKRFDTKTFAKNMECSRVSFASEEDMLNILGVTHGNASVMSILNDKDNIVQVVLDKEVASDEYFACNTGICTTHIKLKTSDLINKFLDEEKHIPKIIEL